MQFRNWLSSKTASGICCAINCLISSFVIRHAFFATMVFPCESFFAVRANPVSALRGAADNQGCKHQQAQYDQGLLLLNKYYKKTARRKLYMRSSRSHI